MTIVTTLDQPMSFTLPRSRPLTRADLDDLPDDGHRYELIDGILIVSPAPRFRHQRGVVQLAILLEAACPDDMVVLVAPFDVALADDSLMQPDVLVARRDEVTDRDLPVAPVLAIEVLSPSTRRMDLTLKPSRLAEAGCLHYWVLDPDLPSLTAWALRDGVYVEVGHVERDETYEAQSPFPLRLTPSRLIR